MTTWMLVGAAWLFVGAVWTFLYIWAMERSAEIRPRAVNEIELGENEPEPRRGR